jgi:hypothetical protein
VLNPRLMRLHGQGMHGASELALLSATANSIFMFFSDNGGLQAPSRGRGQGPFAGH